MLAVTLVEARLGPYGFTEFGDGGFLGDLFPGGRAFWVQEDGYARSEDIPGVRIPDATFPGIVTTLRDAARHRRILELARVAVDLRIGQLVDSPNVGVTAVLPLDVFVEDERR